MAIELTAQAYAESQKIAKTIVLILEIDGIDLLFGSNAVLRTPRYGEPDLFFGKPGLVYGGTLEEPGSRDVVSFKDGTTKSFTSQLNQDRGGTGSVQAINISLVDRRKQVAKALQGIELLGRKANVYLNFDGIPFKENAIRILSGIISNFEAPTGLFKFKVDNADQLKRQNVFINIKGELTAIVNPGDTTIPVITTAGVLPDQDVSDTYIQISDEIIKVGAITPTSFTGCARAQFDTIADSYEPGDEFSTIYQLVENPLILALKIMLSGIDYYKTGNISTINDASSGPNTILVTDANAEESFGLSIGDFVSIEGSGAGNNRVDTEIIGFGQTNGVSYIEVDPGTPLVFEGSNPNLIYKLKSQYSVLPSGCGMGADQVDVAQHLSLLTLVGSGIPNFTIRLKDDIEAKELIESELYFPIGGYFLPRKGRSSVGFTLPPLALLGNKTFGQNNIVNASNITTKRSITKNFYNSIIYKYDLDAVEDKFLKSTVTFSATSIDRIPVGNKALTIDSIGLNTADATTEAYIDSVSTRLLDRYRFGATSFTIDVKFGDGFNIEVGDVIYLNGEGLVIYDYQTSQRDSYLKLMEVTNKSMNVTTGDIKLELTDTAFDVDARYATYSPGSIIKAGSTTTLLALEKSYANSLILDPEQSKYTDFVGQTIIVRSSDYTFYEEVTLEGLPTFNGDALLVSPLSVVPSPGWFIEAPKYNNASEGYKVKHGFYSAQVDIVTGISSTSFAVGASDASKFFVGSILDIHTDDYSSRSREVQVLSIVGTTINTTDIGFTPNNTYRVDQIGFASDEGGSYVYF